MAEALTMKHASQQLISTNMNRTKSVVIILLVIAVMAMIPSNQLSIYASSTTEDNDAAEIPYCDEVDEADPGYNGTCFDSEDYDEVTGLAPCKDGSQVQNYKDCPDRQDKR